VERGISSRAGTVAARQLEGAWREFWPVARSMPVLPRSRIREFVLLLPSTENLEVIPIPTARL